MGRRGELTVDSIPVPWFALKIIRMVVVDAGWLQAPYAVVFLHMANFA